MAHPPAFSNLADFAVKNSVKSFNGNKTCEMVDTGKNIIALGNITIYE